MTENAPNPNDPGVFEVINSSWIRKDNNYNTAKERGFDIDPDSLPEISEDEHNENLKREKQLRMELRAINTFQMNPDQIAQLMIKSGCDSLLLEWARMHKLNRAHIMRIGQGDILIVPTSQDLLQASEIIAKSKEADL